MKKKKKNQNVAKGAPSGFVISLLVHAGAFLLAGMLVVFSVVKKEEKKFVPPKPVDRPKMKLRKPKVQVKKSSKPKSTTRIVTKVQKASMPDIQLPEMSGIGDGLAGDIGGFDIAPDLSEVTLFGGGQTIGNDFVGTFYDFKRSRSGGVHSMDTEMFKEKIGQFVRSGFKPSKLSRFYRSPKKLYATSFMVPTVRSSTAPTAFGEEETGGWCWMAHYKGQLVNKEGITFRFVGQGDDILIVRVDGEVVLNASWPGTEQDYSNWQSNHGDNRTYRMGNNYAVIGDWITLEPGVPLDMEVVCGEVPGGHFDMMLCIEEKGVEYARNERQAPMFPMFKTAAPTYDLQDAIAEWLVAGEVAITDGPVFSDFGSSKSSGPETVEPIEMPEPTASAEDKARLWTFASGKTLEAEYVKIMGSTLVLKTPKGKMKKFPLAEVSETDREFISLSNPPKLNIGFTKQSGQKFVETSPYLDENAPRIFDWIFGAKIKQTSAGTYEHELNVEYFAIGQQYLDDSKFILLDRDSSTFTLSEESQRSFVMKGERKVETMNYDMHSQARGERYKGYLILVRDKRGEIIQHAASSDWLFEHREQLASLNIGNYFDKSGTRVRPTGPKKDY